MEKSDDRINVDEHLGLVHSCVKRFVGKGIEYEDLYQAGCVGLVKAAKGFDKSRGLCFSTYAVTVILGEIRHQFRDGGSIKVSRSLKELSLKVEKQREIQRKILGREPTVAELSSAMGVEREKITEAIASSRAVISIDKTEDDDHHTKTELADTLGEEKLIDKLSVKEAIERLSPDERELILLRYYKDKTQNDTAKMLGISQVQVSRREKVILMKMKDILSA